VVISIAGKDEEIPGTEVILHRARQQSHREQPVALLES
jgi:hypothetical protein